MKRKTSRNQGILAGIGMIAWFVIQTAFLTVLPVGGGYQGILILFTGMALLLLSAWEAALGVWLIGQQFSDLNLPTFAFERAAIKIRQVGSVSEVLFVVLLFLGFQPAPVIVPMVLVQALWIFWGVAASENFHRLSSIRPR